jgi:hypothetical protein
MNKTQLLDYAHDMCKIGNLYALKVTLSNNKIVWKYQDLFRLACDNKQYHIMRYLALNYYCIFYLFTNAYGSILFNHYCRERKIDIVIEIIKITIKEKRIINLNQRETINIGRNTYFQPIMYQLTKNIEINKNIINYLESCGAGIINMKLIL